MSTGDELHLFAATCKQVWKHGDVVPIFPSPHYCICLPVYWSTDSAPKTCDPLGCAQKSPPPRLYTIACYMEWMVYRVPRSHRFENLLTQIHCRKKKNFLPTFSRRKTPRLTTCLQHDKLTYIYAEPCASMRSSTKDRLKHFQWQLAYLVYPTQNCSHGSRQVYKKGHSAKLAGAGSYQINGSPQSHVQPSASARSVADWTNRTLGLRDLFRPACAPSTNCTACSSTAQVEHCQSTRVNRWH